MKIAVLGTESNSCHLAPYGDPSWHIWGCSPGLYPIAQRVDAWFELHRWEPPVIGVPSAQKPWFTPEYVLWMGQRKCPVWMNDKVPEIPSSRALPVQDLVKKWGDYFFTSSIAWMLAMAIDTIQADRERRAKEAAALERVVKANDITAPAIAPEQDCIGLFGVDMSAAEEYMWQRPGCHFFITMAHALKIRLVVPEESDILRPPPLYGISESWHRSIKFLARTDMLKARLRNVEIGQKNLADEAAFVKGALDDNEYHRRTWIQDYDVHAAHIAGAMAGHHIFEEPIVASAPTPRPLEAALASSAGASEAESIPSVGTFVRAGEKLDKADRKKAKRKRR